VVQALPSSHNRSRPLHMPDVHVASIKHSLPGSHDVPSGSRVSTHFSSRGLKVELWQDTGVGHAGMANPSPVSVNATVPPSEEVPVSVALYGPGSWGANRTRTSTSEESSRPGSPCTVKGASTCVQRMSSGARPALDTRTVASRVLPT
jgi:hypothetical protein